MRLFALILALVSLAFGSFAFPNTAPVINGPGSITMIGTQGDDSFEITVTYSTNSQGRQVGKVKVEKNGEERGTTYKFTYLSYSCTALEGYWGNPGGISISIKEEGDSSGLITIPGYDQMVIKQKP